MAIVLDPPPTQSSVPARQGRFVLDPHPRPSAWSLIQSQARKLYNLPSQALTGQPLGQLRESITAYLATRPESRLLPTLTEAMLPRTNLPLIEGLRAAGAQGERQTRAAVLGGLATAPLDPTTYAFLPASMIASTPLRVGASAMVGATPALLMDERPN